MYEDLLKWTQAVKQKMNDSQVENVAFAIEIKNQQKHAVIINPHEVSEEENFNNLSLYINSKEVLALVWGFKRNGKMVFYQKILQEEFKQSSLNPEP